MTAPRLYLASASPRRRELLARLGVPYSVGVAPLDEAAEQMAYTGPVAGLAEYLARAKARSALAAPFPTVLAAPAAAADPAHPAHVADSADVVDIAPSRDLAVVDASADPVGPALVLAADTTVLLAGRVLGKPADPDEAVRMLRALRAREHAVVTAVALGVAPSSDDPATMSTGGDPPAAIRAISVSTRVRMRNYTDDEIATYVASGDPLDKAGAYGVQHPTFRPVAAIAGCYTSVVGLPLCATAALLTVAGLPPLASLEPADATESPGPCPFAARCRPPLPVVTRAAHWWAGVHPE